MESNMNISPWQAALMTAGGNILANNRRDGSMGAAIGSGVASFAPAYFAAKGAQDRQKYLETLQKYKQQEFEDKQAQAQQAQAQQQMMRQGIESGSALQGMPESLKNAALQAYKIGGVGMAQKVVEEGLTRAPKDPSMFERFMDPAQRDAVMAFKRAGASSNSTTVNMPDQIQFGKIDPGYMMVQENGGYQMRPVPGSPAALEMQDRAKAEIAGAGQRQQKSDIVTQDIDRALTKVNENPRTTTGAFGSVLSQVPGTEAHDVSALVDTIKANSAFDTLQAMRNASKTGGALGAVSERELRLLQSTVGSLEQSQSEEQFTRNLSRVRDVYEDIVHGPGGGSKPTRAGPPAGVPDDIGAILQKYQ